MEGSLAGISVIRQRTTDLKRRFIERAAKRRQKKTADREEAEQNEWSALEKGYIIRMALSEDSGMMSCAIVSSRVASSVSSTDGSSDPSTSTSSLYQATMDPYEPQIIHPIIHKRDIYLENRNGDSAEVYSKRKDKLRDMTGVSNGGAAKSTLLPFSVTGSMLCRDMENGRLNPAGTGTTAPQNMMSPQKPMGLPANTIMASMLFRTLEKEDMFTYGRDGKRSSDKREEATIPAEITSRETAGSTVSSVTMYSGDPSSADPSLIKAGNNLLSILQMNDFAAFDAKPKAILYEA